ncbi:MAG: hypothetical protein AAGC71_06535 [Pseudomonadota bacterium]
MATSTTRRTVWLTLVALIVPALVPAGYMPTSQGYLALCPAGLPSAALEVLSGALEAPTHAAHHGQSHAHHHGDQSEPHATHEFRCELGDGLSLLALVSAQSGSVVLPANGHVSDNESSTVRVVRRVAAYRSRAPPTRNARL